MIYRALAFLIGISVLVSGLLIAPSFELQISSGNAEGSYSVKAVDQSVVCPGPLIKSGGSDGTKIGVFKKTGAAEVRTSVAAEGELEISELNSKQREALALETNRQTVDFSFNEPIELRVISSTSEQGSLALSGIQQQLVQVDGLAGFAAASCGESANDFWIIGGSTETAREALLLLFNPSPIDATVDLRIFTDLGEAKVSGLSGISVLARSSIVLPLSSFVPGAGKIAVQVQSESAKLAGWIQQKSVRGTSPQGVDLIGANPGAGKELVIPGFVIRGSEQIARLSALEGNSDSGHALRVFAPEGAQITIQVVSADPEAFGAVFVGEVAEGTVEDFPILELEDGDYSVFISADKPVFASLHAARASGTENPTLDFAWINPAEEVSGTRAIVLPNTSQSILMIANPGSAPADVEVVDLISGASQTLNVLSTGTISLEVSGVISISSTDQVYAGVTVLRDGGISDLEILDPRNIGSEVRVVFR